MRFAGANDEIIGGILLQDLPHGFHVFGCIAPVSPRVQIAEIESILPAGKNSSNTTSNLARDERFAAPRALVIEQNAVGGVEMIALAVNPRHPMRVNFCRGVGTARLKSRRFALRRRSGAKHFRARRLVKTGLRAAAANRFEKPHRAEAGDVAGVFGNIEADFDVALRREMVKLVRRKTVNQIQYPFRAGQVAVMEEQFRSRLIGILINVIDARSIEGARAADDSVDLVAFRKQQLGKVGAILSGDAGDERAFHVIGPLQIAPGDSPVRGWGPAPPVRRWIYIDDNTAGSASMRRPAGVKSVFFFSS